MQDDRKKVMILGALFVVIIAVGAFQLKPSGPAPAPKPFTPPAAVAVQTQAQTQTKDAAPTASTDLPPLPERDPFAAPPKAAAPAAAPTPAATPGPQIHPMSGVIPPMGIPNAQMVKESGLPAAGPTAPAPKAEPTMNWRLTGVVTGAHPLAILADATGNQRLIRVGSAIDPDSALTSVSKNSATIVFRGKTLHLFVSGDPNAK